MDAVRVNLTTVRTNDDWIVELWFDDQHKAIGVSAHVETEEEAIHLAVRSMGELFWEPHRIKDVRARRRYMAGSRFQLDYAKPVTLARPEIYRRT